MSIARQVVLSPTLRGQVRRHFERAGAEECCGILTGRDSGRELVIEAVVATANEHPGDRRCAFRIPAVDLLRAQRSARAEGLEVIGYYHSHPTGDARPSAADLHAAWVGWSYLIAAPSEDGGMELRSWRLQAPRQEFREEKILANVETSP